MEKKFAIFRYQFAEAMSDDKFPDALEPVNDGFFSEANAEQYLRRRRNDLRFSGNKFIILPYIDIPALPVTDTNIKSKLP